MRTAPPNPKRVARGGTGDNTPQTVPFEFQDSTDIKVTSRVVATGLDTILVEGTHYNVSGGSGSTGMVTPIDGATNFPNTVSWIITGDEDYEQDTNLVQGDDTPHDALEIQLDRIVDQITELKEEVNRCIKIPVGDLTGTSVEVDNEVDRANKYLIYDGSGNPSTLATGASGGTDLIIASGDRYVSTTARTAAQRWSEIIRVEDYNGIAPDGTDQYAKIQALLDNICALSQNPNGAEVIFGNGNYRTDTELNVWAGGIEFVGQGVGVTTHHSPSSNAGDKINIASTSLYAGVAMSSGVVRFAPKDVGGELAEDQILAGCGLRNMLVSGADLSDPDNADDIALADYGIVVENCHDWRGRDFASASTIVAGVWAHAVTPIGSGSTQKLKINGYSYDYGRKAAAYDSDGIMLGDPTVTGAGCVFSELDNVSGLVYNGDLVSMQGGAVQNRIGNVFWQAGGGGTGNSVAFYYDTSSNLAALNHLAYTNGPVYCQGGTYNTAGEMLFADGSIHIESGAVLKRTGGVVNPTDGALYTNFGNQMTDRLYIPYTDATDPTIPPGAFVGAAAAVGEFGTASSLFGCLQFTDGVDDEASFLIRPPNEWAPGFITFISFYYGAPAGVGSQTFELNVGIKSSNNIETVNPPTSAGAGWLDVSHTTGYVADSLAVKSFAIPDANGNDGGIFFEKWAGSPLPSAVGETISVHVIRTGSTDSWGTDWHLVGLEIRYEACGPGWLGRETITISGSTITHAGTDTNYKTDDFGPVRFYSSTNDLPPELQADTDYWLEYQTDTTARVQASPGGGFITFSDTGSGTAYMYKASNVGDDST